MTGLSEAVAETDRIESRVNAVTLAAYLTACVSHAFGHDTSKPIRDSWHSFKEQLIEKLMGPAWEVASKYPAVAFGSDVANIRDCLTWHGEQCYSTIREYRS
jgi:effector-binding domain-containing protein